ncbi:hypothetical protein D3C75_1340620 [compost metagenome]
MCSEVNRDFFNWASRRFSMARSLVSESPRDVANTVGHTTVTPISKPLSSDLRVSDSDTTPALATL